MSQLDQFMVEYERQLTLAVQNYPDEYVWPIADVPKVAAKMRAAFERRSYNKDGRAIKATCKVLGIPYTYAGINAYLSP